MSVPILYDIPSKAPKESWSLNPWKTRLALNFKKIDYKTEWVEYPDLAPLFKSYGIPPNDPNDVDYFTDYSSPAMKFPDGTYVMESKSIAREIEKRYPEPALHPDSPLAVESQAAVRGVLHALGAEFLPYVPRNLLTPRSEEFFEVDRKRRLGMSLMELRETKGGEAVWEAVKEPAKVMADLLKKKKGPFLEGEHASYADFPIVGFLQMIKRIDQRYFDRFVALDPVFVELYNAAKPYLERADH